MGAAGNSTDSAVRRRFDMALRGGQPARVLAAAREVQDHGTLTLQDAARICVVLAEHQDHRFPRAAGRLVARIALALNLEIDDVDLLVDLVAFQPDDRRRSQLLVFCERADEASAAR